MESQKLLAHTVLVDAGFQSPLRKKEMKASMKSLTWTQNFPLWLLADRAANGVSVGVP